MLQCRFLPAVLAIATLLALSLPSQSFAQTARISEEIRTLETYPFSEPNRVPILTRDTRLYPYHSFEGYAVESEPRDWKVVRLENDYIEVFVLPEVGGKVWGAIVKETGHEFIYRNEVMKFRNIALRGPWTSGGIEFNFGVIGHTPATATPVDYVLRENADGSVSCIVGGMDLPSRTQWRVEIRLAPDKAYFETNVLWFNPTPLEQPYYNWMTAAAFARDDLEMSIPGNAYLTHPGNEMQWPLDPEGRYLPRYGNNTFAGHKSYHVVGELNDFFGGYYLDDDYGFGHWSRYEDMPGQKLWLWALSREGGVWEELLTDTDGQYVEFQAGRLFVQYSPDPDVNPVTQAGFDPLSASRWSETWFPLEGIGGLTDASREGAMHVSVEDGLLNVSVNSFTSVQDTLLVWAGSRLVAEVPVDLRPLMRLDTTFAIGPADRFRVRLPALDLDYDSDPSDRLLSRSFSTNAQALSSIPEVDQSVFEARELMKGRRYEQARALFERVLREQPWNREGLLGVAELSYRAGNYVDALANADRVLQLDAYDAEANFLAGTLYRALFRTADARDAFGWAVRSTAYRTAGYTQLAELMISEHRYSDAARYTRLAIDFDRHGIPAWRALAVVGRRTGNTALIAEAHRELLDIDPLHHFVQAERYLAGRSSVARDELVGGLTGEYPEQTLLELAITYFDLWLPDDASALLALQADVLDNPLAGAWRAFIAGDAALLSSDVDLDFVFPFRRESLQVLTWAASESDDWAWTYLRALNLWAVGRQEESADLITGLGDTPDFAAFYATRGLLLHQLRGTDPVTDLRLAVALAPEDRALHVYLIRHLQDVGDWAGSESLIASARTRFPDDFNLALLAAKTLIHTDRSNEAVEILDATHVLPSESGRESHLLFAQAHTLAALNDMDAGRHSLAIDHLAAGREWPESLGQGRPYEPEERLIRFLLGEAFARSGQNDAGLAEYRAVVDASAGLPSVTSRLDLLAIAALDALGESSELARIAAATSEASDAARVTAATSQSSDVARFAALYARALVNAGVDAADVARGLAEEFAPLFGDLDGRMILRALTLRD